MYFQSQFRSILTIVALIVFVSTSFSQKIIEKTSAEKRIEWYNQHLKVKAGSVFNTLP